MGSNQPAIHLENIGFHYDKGRPILNDLNFAIEAKKRVGLVGANGSGKTTLFYIIMGLLCPKQGRVEIFGKERKCEDDFLDVRQKIGLLFQDSNDQLFSPTVAEDIAFGPLNLGKKHHETEEIVKRTLEAVGLPGYQDRITYKLSGGEKRLVALGTILAMEPQILLLDEPFAGLDEAARVRVAKVLSNSDIGHVIISHRKEDLRKLSDEIFVLRDGKIH